MLKKITFSEVERIYKNGEIGKVLYLYSDGTEAYIDNNAKWVNIARHFNNGGKFAIETDEKKIKSDKGIKRYPIYFSAEDYDVAYVEMTRDEAELVHRILKDANSQVSSLYAGHVSIGLDESE